MTHPFLLLSSSMDLQHLLVALMIIRMLRMQQSSIFDTPFNLCSTLGTSSFIAMRFAASVRCCKTARYLVKTLRRGTIPKKPSPVFSYTNSQFSLIHNVCSTPMLCQSFLRSRAALLCVL